MDRPQGGPWVTSARPVPPLAGAGPGYVERPMPLAAAVLWTPVGRAAADALYPIFITSRALAAARSASCSSRPGAGSRSRASRSPCGSGSLEGSGRDVSVATDDSGFAILPLRVGRRLATYRLEVVTTSGGTLPGRPSVELVVRAGPPATAQVEPPEVVFENDADSLVPIVVTVRDSVGHPVAGESVVLGGTPEAAGFRPDTALTDSLGRARVFVQRGGARRPGGGGRGEPSGRDPRAPAGVGECLGGDAAARVGHRLPVGRTADRRRPQRTGRAARVRGAQSRSTPSTPASCPRTPPPTRKGGRASRSPSAIARARR